ncbi:hypothetical protein ACFYWX_19020 [Streptomyces sp. NPDC002888]|uniref:hypothetical protein n=1 Tax=Streptomyces sp. NPDC002888 TaxID=3364668 RepID=UPI0036A29FC4
MIYLFDTKVVAELTTRAKPDPRVLAWFRSTARPNRFLSVITVAESFFTWEVLLSSQPTGPSTSPIVAGQEHFSLF